MRLADSAVFRSIIHNNYDGNITEGVEARADDALRVVRHYDRADCVYTAQLLTRLK
jgi:hypothetical protein